MIVCVCHRISDRDIRRAVVDGTASFDDLQIDTGVATRCGRCADCARQHFDQACAQPLGGLQGLQAALRPFSQGTALAA